MVTIKAVHLRESEDKGPFVSLELTGEVELIQSQTTGRHYATARRCFISSTFDIDTAKQLVGKQLKGNIVRVQCDPYDYTIKDTGEIISLAYSWDYSPEEGNASVARQAEMEPA